MNTAFAMIINTAQVQMPNHVGIYTPFFGFSHGQLYGAFLTMLMLQLLKGIKNTQKMIRYTTPNILYQEVL
jgi:hypothetical protein